MKPKRAIVVGSGLSGMSAAWELLKAGTEVLMLEKRSVLGGRTASWDEHGMLVESGLHRFLGFYTALPEFLEEVGLDLDDILIWEDEIEIRLPDTGEKAVFHLAPLHEPIDTITSFLGNNDFLSPGEKAELIPFFTKGLLEYRRDPVFFDTKSVRQFAEETGVSERVITRVLTPFTAGILFLPPERYSAKAFFELFQGAFRKMYKMRIGAFSGGMTEVMMDPLAKKLEERGAIIQKNTAVNRLLLENGRVVGVQTNEGPLWSDAVVLATSLAPAQAILRASFENLTPFMDMLALPTEPAVTVQIELDRPSMEVDHTTFGPGTALASFAEQSRTTFRGPAGRISLILSPPEKYVDLSDASILDTVLTEAERLDIQLDKAVKDCRVIRHPQDFACLAVGHDHLRPVQQTSIPGLALAGDYTRQEASTTMEGAVLSGRQAAQSFLTGS